MGILPFVVFAGESPVNKFTDGNRIVNIIQNNYEWDFRGAAFSIDLIGQIRQVKLQVLHKKHKKTQYCVTPWKSL